MNLLDFFMSPGGLIILAAFIFIMLGGRLGNPFKGSRSDGSTRKFGGKEYYRYSYSDPRSYSMYQREAKEFRKDGIPARAVKGKTYSALYIRKDK